MEENERLTSLTQHFQQQLEAQKITLLKQLLPVFDAAIENTRRRGIVTSALALIGVYYPYCELFDPRFHECVATARKLHERDQKVLRVAKNGWHCGDSVLRFAEVVVNELD